MTSRDRSAGHQTFVRWWRRFWIGTLALVLVTIGAVYLEESTRGGQGGDPGDAAAIPVTVGAVTCVFLVLLWAVACSVGFVRERRSLSA